MFSDFDYFKKFHVFNDFDSSGCFGRFGFTKITNCTIVDTLKEFTIWYTGNKNDRLSLPNEGIAHIED